MSGRGNVQGEYPILAPSTSMTLPAMTSVIIRSIFLWFVFLLVCFCILCTFSTKYMHVMGFGPWTVWSSNATLSVTNVDTLLHGKLYRYA